MSSLTEEQKVVLLPGELEELLEMWRPRMFTAAAGSFVAACRDQRNGCLHRALTTGDKNSLNVLRRSARTTSDGSPAALLFSGWESRTEIRQEFNGVKTLMFVWTWNIQTDSLSKKQLVRAPRGQC